MKPGAVGTSQSSIRTSTLSVISRSPRPGQSISTRCSMMAKSQPTFRPLFDAAEFIRQSPLWREMQYDALKARLRGVAAAEGLQIVNIQRINQSVVGLTAYVG